MVPSLPSSHRTEVYEPKPFFPHAALLGQAFAHCPIFPTAASRRSLGRVSVPMWPITLSGRLPIVGLVGRYLTNYLIGREPTPNRIAPLTPVPCGPVVSCGIRTPFGILSPCLGQVAHALLPRPPLKHNRFHPKTSANVSPLDLHVLGTPPAFVLSQDQTLPFNPFKSAAPAADPHSSESSVSLRFFALYRFQGSHLSARFELRSQRA